MNVASPKQSVEQFEEIDTSSVKPKVELKENVSLLDRGKGIKKQSRTNSPSPSIPPGSKTNMTRDQIKYCGAIMRNLKKHRDAAPFLHPVDYVKLNVPDYPKVIQHPMDLTTVDHKLNAGEYENVEEFINDIRLVFNNCFKFNGPEAMISMLCQNVESAFEKSLRQMPPSRGSTPPPRSVSPVLFDGDEGERGIKKRKKSTTTSNIKHVPIHHNTNNNNNNNNNINTREDSPQYNGRRISEDGRPKREIHPPPSKDYPEPMTKRRNPRKNDLQMKFCAQTLRELKKNKYRDINYPFLAPVDVVALNIPDYVNIVKHPMDLATIERKLTEGDYDEPDQFEADIRLMFNNCYLYNPPNLPVHKMGRELEKVFDEKWAQRPSTPLPTPVIDEATEFEDQTHDDDEDDDDDDEDESDQDDRDQKIAELERHIATISQQIASIKSLKRKKPERPPPRRQSKPVVKEKKPVVKEKRKRVNKKKDGLAQSAPLSSSSTSTAAQGKTSTASSGPSHHNQQAHKSVNSSGVGLREELPEFTFDQKKDLSERINNLSGDSLNTVVNIIQSSMPNLDGQGQEEIVLDIDSLDRPTLHRLHEFVTGESLVAKKSSSPSSKRPRTHYSERDADRKIRELEETLQKFNSDSSSDSGDSDSSSGSDSDDSGSSSD
ncbi:Bromodomain-containing protein [Mucor mucedo]|uniref:Bromodomain-containing protein n=1 Tax=Mucor mucedo TaxID=29922 RepID=UPI002220CFB6|nr:Bromodomain-containing protein [Mucor mucedo]KAI7890294.1 Bromodomain-containing protein [Mucor mucedo]